MISTELTMNLWKQPFLIKIKFYFDQILKKNFFFGIIFQTTLARHDLQLLSFKRHLTWVDIRFVKYQMSSERERNERTRESDLNFFV